MEPTIEIPLTDNVNLVKKLKGSCKHTERIVVQRPEAFKLTLAKEQKKLQRIGVLDKFEQDGFWHFQIICDDLQTFLTFACNLQEESKKPEFENKLQFEEFFDNDVAAS